MARETTPEKPPRSIAARVLASVALVAVIVAIVAVISSSVSDSGKGDGDRDRRPRAEQTQPTDFEGDVYVVEPGDTLTSVSAKTGISIEKLLRLNPDLDPETLGTGQTLNLR